ncbi:hypothetical protein C9374_002547 [Naegleria lovaniensis]|uniref:Uncharacterized protein n=1 Tax=Naegleria lovaniensis TaxID=51637 RepID=A0AA88GPS3_NAELO|nr:uncharacterized protein C9374_002547 [Naegleria lovaniensis]KAG2386101.1 hypothetical protein C9374_002547 [Naegleria lovaniensis]
MVETVLSSHQYTSDDDSSSDFLSAFENSKFPHATTKIAKTIPPLKFPKSSSQQDLSLRQSSSRRNNDTITTPKSSSRDRYSKNTTPSKQTQSSSNKNSSSRLLNTQSSQVAVDNNNVKDVTSTPTKLANSRKQSVSSLRQLESSLPNKPLQDKPNSTPRSSRTSTNSQQLGKSTNQTQNNLPHVINNSKINHQENSIKRLTSSKVVKDSSKSSNLNTTTPRSSRTSSSINSSSSSTNNLGQLVKSPIPPLTHATSSNLSTSNNVKTEWSNNSTSALYFCSNNSETNSKELNSSLNFNNLSQKTVTSHERSALQSFDTSQKTIKPISDMSKIDVNHSVQKCIDNPTTSSRKELSKATKSSSLPNSSRKMQGNSSQQKKSPLGTNVVLFSHDFGFETDYYPNIQPNEIDHIIHDDDDGSPDDSSIEVLTVRSAVEDMFYKTHSNSQTPRLGKQGSQSSLYGSTSSSRSKHSNTSSHDNEEDIRTFSEKELRMLQQSLSKHSGSNHVVHANIDDEKTENNFWAQVERDHFSLLSDSEKMYTLFSRWIQEEQEDEIKDLYKLQYHECDVQSTESYDPPQFQTYVRDELSKLKKASSIIYEEAFVLIVDYFVNIIVSRHDQSSVSTSSTVDLLLEWSEYISLEFFDYLDIKRIGSTSKESVFMILCLISAQCKRKLCLFLEIFGETIFELCRSSSIVSSSRSLKRSSTQPKMTSIHEARKLAFMCGIDDIQFTKTLVRYNYQDLEWLDLETFLKVYRHIFLKFDRGTLHEKDYFVPPMISPSTDRATAPPISARKVGGSCSSETSSSNRSGVHPNTPMAVASTISTIVSSTTNSNNNSAHPSLEGTALHMDSLCSTINSSSSVVIETASTLSEMCHPPSNAVTSNQDGVNKAQSTQQQPAGTLSSVANALAILASSTVTPLATSVTPNTEMENFYDPPSSGRTPKQIYSSSKKIAFPLRGISQTQLVDTLSENSHQNRTTTNKHSENLGKVQHSLKHEETPYFIEEEISKKQIPLVSDEKFLEETKEKVFVPAHPHNDVHSSKSKSSSKSSTKSSNSKRNKYLVNATNDVTSTHKKTVHSTNEKKGSSRKRWKCCIM